MPVPFARVFVIPLVAALMLAMPASAGAKTYKVTLAARSCPTYADVSANLARNDIQESLQDLGPDTAYSSGQAIDPDIESANQPRCTPITGWEFRIGDGIAGQDVGAFGALSRVRNPSNRTIRTVASTPLFDEYGSNTGRRIAGAVNFNLNNGETNQAFSHSLWVQGGVPGDPVMDSRFPGAYGFAALRCAIDNLNGDNVEYVTFPSGTNHVFCFAYYVTPPPSSGTVIVRKEVTATGGDRHDASFIFDSNLTYDPSGAFSLAVSNNQPASTSFVRAQTRPGDDPWQVRERSMAGWELVSLDCVSADGTSSSTTSGASASISLAAGDTVTCTYVNRPVADGRLYVAKRSRLSTGRFAFAVTTPTNRNLTRSLTTRRPLLPATWATGLDELGTYSIREHLPRAPLGTWFNTAISCDGRSQPAGGAGPVVRATASLGSDGASAYCLFTNT
ncbi:MAG: hypothetical protein KDC46_03045, partial [Thermoleophilia bacterium]|nr:hypothetical protein [Thermoleophilia bacterium]